jgi:hypothetical protein
MPHSTGPLSGRCVSIIVRFPFAQDTLAQAMQLSAYRGTWLIRKRTPLEPYRMPMHRVLEGS